MTCLLNHRAHGCIYFSSGTAGGENSSLLKEWFELMRERSELRRYERELLVRRQEMELEDRHARLQHELRLSLAKDGK